MSVWTLILMCIWLLQAWSSTRNAFSIGTNHYFRRHRNTVQH